MNACSKLAAHRREIAETLALLYIALIAGVAAATGLPFLLFPELAALSHDVLTRPRGEWASQPVRLAFTPVVTAVVGTLITRRLPYHALSILLVVGLGVVIIRALRSAIAPAISAGLLPLVLHIESWTYPVCIALGVVGLVALSLAWRAITTRMDGRDAQPPTTYVRRGRWWPLALLSFVTAAGLAAQLSGLRFLLFPPLAVMAYEMFRHPNGCEWGRRPLAFAAACSLTALAGVVAFRLFGTGATAAGSSLAVGVLVLRALRIHLPPALAVGLIPLVMPNPTLAYPFSVAVGTLSLAAWSIACQRTSAHPASP